MPKQLIKLHFQNGLNLESFTREVFDIEHLTQTYDFQESSNPDFIIFGPYGNDIPPKGNYTRVGYFCENIKPDLSICEWAFGIPREEEIKNPYYKRIQWHNLSPQSLVKQPDFNPEKVLASKTKFCNFLYSNKVPYREKFFEQLSKYKKVDAPGRSMNNMPNIDHFYKGTKWEIKRQFLSEYKFTIAFENDIYPGYQTEKLYDAMIAASMPVYFGDPFVGDVFNTKSFINITECLPKKHYFINRSLQQLGQLDFEDIRPAYLKNPKQRIKRKVKFFIRELKVKVNFPKRDFSTIIDLIAALDKRPELYLKYLEQPWLNGNLIPNDSLSKKRWMEIFNSK